MKRLCQSILFAKVAILHKAIHLANYFISWARADQNSSGLCGMRSQLYRTFTEAAFFFSMIGYILTLSA